LSRAPQPAELDLSAFDGRIPIELLGRSVFPPIGTLPYFITLPGYGFYWFLLAEEAEAPKWHEPSAPPAPELVTVVLPQGWASMLVGEPAKALETRVLPEFLTQRRWFGAKDRAVAKVDVVQLAPALHELGHALFAILRVGFAHSEQQEIYNSPLTIIWEDGSEERLPGALPFALARVRSGRRVGFLADAMGDDSFVRGVVAAMRDNREIDGLEGRRLVFRGSSALPHELNVSDLVVQRTAREQSNTSVHLGEDLILKLYRRLQPGIHPELEVGQYLTEMAKFANTPALLGSLVAIDEGGQETALAALSAYVRNQGDGWDFTLDYLKRFIEEADLLGAAAPESLADRHGVYLSLAATLGRRTAELHGAFAHPAEDDAFAPEPIGHRDVKRWLAEISERARAAFATVQAHRGALTGDVRQSAQRFLKSRRAVMQHIKSALPDVSHSMKTRCHGDLHLGQVIVVQNDFFFVDFEGEPAAPLAERRAKHMPLRDVAGMLRSFDYASWAALRADAAVRPESHDLVKSLLTDWRRRVWAAYVRGYREAIRGCPSCPEEEPVQDQWINFFMLEKALYEVTYEAANRPAWIDIPMEGVLDLVGAKP
jgi:maltose alpha-D-glucosyltransferase/alpha-amylase